MPAQRCCLYALAATVGLVAAPDTRAFAGCGGEADIAVVNPGQTVTLNPGGGSNDPLDQAIVVFTNGNDSEPATVEVCELGTNPNAGALGYDAYDRLLSLNVTFEQDDPDNEDTFVARVMMPFVDADVPVGPGLLGPEATELTYFNMTAWSLAAVGNEAISPGYAETVGDRTTVVGTSQPGSFSDEVGDYGIFWHTDELRGFVWANVDQSNEFAPGAPYCWADLDGDGVVSGSDLLMLLPIYGSDVDPGGFGDIFVDGEIELKDLAQLIAFWGGSCFLPPDVAAIRHSVESVVNSAGDAEWGAGSGGYTHLTWDLQVEMDPDDIDNWWTTTEAVAELTDPVYDALSFYQHPDDAIWEGSSVGAAPYNFWCNFAGFEAARFDSYYIEATDTDPCDATQPLAGAFEAAGFIESPTLLHAAWYDASDFAAPVEGSPPFSIARYTILVDRDDTDCPTCHLDLDIVPTGASPDPVVGTIGATTTHRFGLSNLIPFSFDIVDVCAADVDDNGTVSTADLLELLSDWGDGGVRSDLDRNGIVSTSDLLRLLSRWGSCN
jgi:hypothetical protein